MAQNEELDGFISFIAEIEQTIGIVSSSQKTIDKGHIYDIPLNDKPAQQFLEQLGVKTGHQLLSTIQEPLKTAKDQITISSFVPKSIHSELIINTERTQELIDSGKIHVNTGIVPPGAYQKALKDGSFANPEESTGSNWDNLAVGICHSQKIELLVGSTLSESTPPRSHVTPREGSIDTSTPSLLLLSSSRLELSPTHIGHIKDKNEQIRLIKGMYRTLFDAAVSEEYEYIVMPAAGIGRHDGNAELYFTLLIEVAKEFPKLNIIYHTGKNEKHAKLFDELLQKDRENKNSAPSQITRATKDIIFIADRLSKLKKHCAIHNPSSREVIYGTCDVGGPWKFTNPLSNLLRDASKSFQTILGTISTAPLGSRGITKAYNNIIEKNLNPTDKQKKKASQSIIITEEETQTNHQETHGVETQTKPQETHEAEIQTKPQETHEAETQTKPQEIHGAETQTKPQEIHGAETQTKTTPAPSQESSADTSNSTTLNLPPSVDVLKSSFLELHRQKLTIQQQGFFGCFRRTRIQESWSLAEILEHASAYDNRSRDICVSLGWLNKDGSLNPTADQLIANNYPQSVSNEEPKSGCFF